uniref:Immunoglobulin subtype 2 domain-containing protein n=1 Tax=Octopus bimaculoides TaxID=37653 RepID=A0A0L8FJN5_OCTBM
MMYLAIGLLILFVAQTHSQTEPMGLKSYLGSDVVMTCVNATMNGMPKWILPHGKMVDEEKYEIYNKSLKIKSVTEEDRGIYACTSRDDAVYNIYLLNMAGPLFDSTSDKYHTQFLIGGIASVVMLGICTIVLLTYHFHYETRERKHGEAEGNINNGFTELDSTQL